jgi:hypothetical protein
MSVMPQMLFTWNTNNLCIVFSWWHITSTFSLVISLLAIVALGAGYEALREGIRQYEAAVNKRVETAPRKYISWNPFFSSFAYPLSQYQWHYVTYLLPFVARLCTMCPAVPMRKNIPG